MGTDIFIKNPILFVVSNNYEAQTPHINHVLETLSQAVTETYFYPTDGKASGVWEDIKNLKIEISEFGINYTWNEVDDDGTFDEGSAVFEWIDRYEYCDYDVGYLDDKVMNLLIEDSKGLQEAIQIANM